MHAPPHQVHKSEVRPFPHRRWGKVGMGASGCRSAGTAAPTLTLPRRSRGRERRAIRHRGSDSGRAALPDRGHIRRCTPLPHQVHKRAVRPFPHLRWGKVGMGASGCRGAGTAAPTLTLPRRSRGRERTAIRHRGPDRGRAALLHRGHIRGCTPLPHQVHKREVRPFPHLRWGKVGMGARDYRNPDTAPTPHPCTDTSPRGTPRSRTCCLRARAPTASPRRTAPLRSR